MHCPQATRCTPPRVGGIRDSVWRWGKAASLRDFFLFGLYRDGHTNLPEAESRGTTWGPCLTANAPLDVVQRGENTAETAMPHSFQARRGLFTQLKIPCAAHASADAHRHQAVLDVAACHFVEEGGGEFCAGAAERVAEGYRAAVDVDDVF